LKFLSADAKSNQTASESSTASTLFAKPLVRTSPERSTPVIQGKFVKQFLGFHIPKEELESLLNEVEAKNKTKVEDTKRMFNAKEYYDWEEWINNWEEKEVKDPKFLPNSNEEEKSAEQIEPEQEKLVAPPTYLPEDSLKYVTDKHQQRLRHLGNDKAKYKSIQMVFHALGKNERIESSKPKDRLKKLEEVVEKAFAARKNQPVTDSVLTVFIAPEGYFSYLDPEVRSGEDKRHQYRKEEYEEIVYALKNFSIKVLNILLIPGSILWYEAAQKQPEYLVKDKKYKAEEIEYTYNTSPVAFEGDIFLYNKHVDSGGDIDPERANQKMKMDKITKTGNEVDPKNIGYFSVGGLHIGLEICGDSGAEILRNGLKKIYGDKNPRVDFQILIAAGQNPSNKGYLSDGWVINADHQFNGISFSAYKIEGGVIDSKKNILDPNYQKMEDKDTHLIIVQQFLDSVSSKEDK
jgi:hypothetical protein